MVGEGENSGADFAPRAYLALTFFYVEFSCRLMPCKIPLF